MLANVTFFGTLYFMRKIVSGNDGPTTRTQLAIYWFGAAAGTLLPAGYGLYLLTSTN